MAKKTRKKRIDKQADNRSSASKDQMIGIDASTERLFKRILKTMSWIVGVAFVLIIILPQFNSKALDSLTQVLYYIGIINLLLFTLIEMVADSVKKMLQKLVGQKTNES